MQNSRIEWTEKTWNPIVGCTPISEGCTNCYAKRIAETRLKLDFSKVVFHPKRLKQVTPRQKPARIFVCSMSDLFHENVKWSWLESIFDLIGECSQHKFLLLTKRPENAKAFMQTYYFESDMKYYENIWLGVTCENQKTADKRIPILLDIPAKVHFVSCEPLLDEINLHKQINWFWAGSGLGWVIVGGETGINAREMNPKWARKIRDDCKETGVPFFFKQMTKKAEIPKDFLIREYPNT